VYLLDTDTCSYAVKQYSEVLVERLRKAPLSSCALSVITYAEIHFGMEDRRMSSQRRAVIKAFLATVAVLDWTPKIALVYAPLRSKLKSLGTPLEDHDTMIAAHALALDATLVTNNTRHFSRIANLRMENWLE
jgi:tRNA(fMet)-specific endonuclease VapC